ncbi:MAG: putative heme transporter [Frankiales bacterium]|jgi:uncharacterized membrane protein YbhN (UPF0104 family)|nr:putative heme transporter [Frankiales bacterium]
MSRRGLARSLIALASIATAGALLGVVFPHVAHAGWDDVTEQVAAIPIVRLLELAVIWAAGLYAYSFVLTAALPGLNRRRALALNLGGSGVSNVIPFGGAAGIGLNYAMLRSWGYDRARVARFTVVSQTIAAASKIIVALCGLVALATLPAIRDLAPSPDGKTWGWIAAGVGGLAVAAFLLRRSIRIPAYSHLHARLGAFWTQTTELVRRHWVPMTAGALGYAALQLLLFELCLNAVHPGLSVTLVAAGYAVDRMLTLVPITPGGVGVVEAGVTAVLVALGGDPTSVATGVLLFRGFSYFAEIPIGGAVALGWLTRRSLRFRSESAT